MSVLSSRDALDNISETRKRIESNKAVVDGQLQAAIEAQSQLLVNGMSSLQRVRSEVQRVQESTSNISSASNISKEAVANFADIQKLHTVVKNFDLTRQFVETFQTLGDEISELNAMMDDPRGSYEEVDGVYFMWLLPIHQKLDQLRGVCKEATRYAAESTADNRRTVSREFKPLDVAIERFDRVLFEIPVDLLELCRSEPTIVVRLAKVVDFEERKELVQGGSSSQNGYPRRMFAVVRETTASKFEEYVAQMETTDRILAKFDWIFKDLKIVVKFLTPLLPQRWKIFDIFVQDYHKQVYAIITKIVKEDPPAALVLQILEWVKAYYIKLEAFGLSKADLSPPLLDGQEKALYDDFLGHLVKKLHEWYKTVAIQEKRPFVERLAAPDNQEDDTLCLNTHMDMNQLVQQQLNAAAESNQSRIVLGCVNACCDLLMQRQKEWCDVVEQEVQKEIEDTEGTVQPGLYEYLIALGNEQERGQIFLEELAQKWTDSLSRKYQSQALEKFEQTEEGFLDVARKCIDGMIQLIVNDLSKAFVDLFSSKNWKKGVTIHQIETTLNEFLGEASSLMIADLFGTFVERLCRSTILHYLRSLRPGCLKAKDRERVLEDVKKLHAVFTNPDYGMEPESAAHFFGVFAPLVDTLTSSHEELPERFRELRSDYWDAPLDLFEKFVAVRRDVDKQKLREIMGKVRVMAVQTQGGGDATFLHGFK